MDMPTPADRTPSRSGPPDRIGAAEPQPSRAAILGHPIHPMLAPFPIVLLMGAFAADVIHTQTRDQFWARASRLMLGAGIVSGLAAGLVGSVDFTGIRRSRNRWGWLHAVGNVGALALAFANLRLRGAARRPKTPALGVWLSGITAALLGLTALAGGELSYRYQIGVKPARD